MKPMKSAGLAACAGGLIAAQCRADTMPTMSGNFLYGVNGALVTGWGWDSLAGGPVADVAVTAGAGLNNPLNPTGTPLPLSLGANHFVGFASWTTPLSAPNVAWSVYLDGASMPQISALTTLATDPNHPPAFGGGSFQAYTLGGGVDAGGPKYVSAEIDGYFVTLTALSISGPGTIPADRMSDFAQGADGFNDWVVRFTVTVLPVPVPGSVAPLCVAGIFAKRSRRC